MGQHKNPTRYTGFPLNKIKFTKNKKKSKEYSKIHICKCVYTCQAHAQSSNLV